MVSCAHCGVDRHNLAPIDKVRLTRGAVTVFTRKRGARLAALVAAAGLVLAACAGDDGEEEVEASPGFDACIDEPDTCNAGERGEGGDITVLINQGHDGVFNSLTSQGNSVYMTQMRQGLEAPVGRFLPSGDWVYNHDLLVGDAELVTEDPLTIRYEFREEAVWSDGEPITVRDVQFQQKHQSGSEEDCDQEVCSPASSAFYQDTVAIEAEDDSGKAFTITYRDDWAHPEWFGRGLFTHPAHIADREGFDWENDPSEMAAASEYFSNTVPEASAGPYVVDSWTADETQVLVPNENWYGAGEVTLDTVVKEVVSDQPTWVPATSNRELHVGFPASFTVDLWQQLDQIPGVYTGVNPNTYSWDHVDFNMDSVTDPALRKAIFTVIDTEDARERIWGDLDELPAMRTGLFLPQANEYHQDHLTETGYGTGDVEAARGILDEAGYTGFEAGETLTDPDGEAVPELRFAFLSGNENRNTFTQLVQSYAADIGLTITPDPTPGDQLGTVLSEQDYDLVIFGWSGNPLIANGPNQFYHSTSPSNFGNLQSDQVDALVTEAMNQTDLDETGRLHNETIPIVLDEAYILPLWDTPDLIWAYDDFANVRDNSAFAPRSTYNIGEWGVLAD
jgi:peptide/nickel transport system substrate-binding protein